MPGLVDTLNVGVPADERARGKGAAEFYAVEEYLSLRNPSGTIYKVTGRLRLRNAARVISELGSNEIRVRGLPNRAYIDTRVVGAGAEAWKFVTPMVRATVDDAAGIYAEHALGAAIAQGSSLGAITASRFRHAPLIVGQSGSTGAQYGRLRTDLARAVLRPGEDLLAWLAAHKQV
ncbi:hypothetical protein [Microbacterium sp. NPDC056736]|uniref:hypothetical protein n=1 Tax=Microbacterium sp. NPDC056736 TaxID=3345932 RepID=UPI0036722FBD